MTNPTACMAVRVGEIVEALSSMLHVILPEHCLSHLQANFQRAHGGRVGSGPKQALAVRKSLTADGLNPVLKGDA